MIYDIRQVTSYAYSSFVPFAMHVVRLAPLPSPVLDVLESEVVVEPKPSEFLAGQDFFGNSIAHVTLKAPHNRLSIAARAVVDVKPRPLVEAETTPPWEEVRAAALEAQSLGPRSPAHQLFPTRLVPIAGELLAYARESFPPGRPVLAGAIDLMARIKADFRYDPTATDVSTPVLEAFRLRRGVCQDFAHIMIGALRGLGLPAAYVSGYLRTVPQEGQPRLEGADAMHAWVSVWCGAEAQWQELDPTNAMRAGLDHIPLAFGRDYADVSPVDGVIFDSGSHMLSVAVDVVERVGGDQA